MNTFKKVVLSGTPHERGVTYGRECRELIDRTIGDYERYFNNKPNLSWDYAIQMAAKFIPAIEAFAPELMEEMHGIAEGCGLSQGTDHQCGHQDQLDPGVEVAVGGRLQPEPPQKIPG